MTGTVSSNGAVMAPGGFLSPQTINKPGPGISDFFSYIGNSNTLTPPIKHTLIEQIKKDYQQRIGTMTASRGVREVNGSEAIAEMPFKKRRLEFLARSPNKIVTFNTIIEDGLIRMRELLMHPELARPTRLSPGVFGCFKRQDPSDTETDNQAKFENIKARNEQLLQNTRAALRNQASTGYISATEFIIVFKYAVQGVDTITDPARKYALQQRLYEAASYYVNSAGRYGIGKGAAFFSSECKTSRYEAMLKVFEKMAQLAEECNAPDAISDLSQLFTDGLITYNLKPEDIIDLFDIDMAISVQAMLDANSAEVYFSKFDQRATHLKLQLEMVNTLQNPGSSHQETE